MSTYKRAGLLLAFAVALSADAAGQETRTFEADNGSYTFSYPPDFALDHEFADESLSKTSM